MRRLSNERLEDQIAQVYQEAHRGDSRVKLREKGLLAELWREFDRRAYEGLITIE